MVLYEPGAMCYNSYQAAIIAGAMAETVRGQPPAIIAFHYYNIKNANRIIHRQKNIQSRRDVPERILHIWICYPSF